MLLLVALSPSFQREKPFPARKKIAQVLETQGAIAASSCPLEVPFAPRSSNTQVLIVSGSLSYQGPRVPQPAQVLALNLKKKAGRKRWGDAKLGQKGQGWPRTARRFALRLGLLINPGLIPTSGGPLKAIS